MTIEGRISSDLITLTPVDSYINRGRMILVRRGREMPTSSFYEDLVIETEEQAQAILKAFDDADKRIERRTNPTSDELIARGERLIEEGFFDELFLRKSN
jgi:hypothetical protein